MMKTRISSTQWWLVLVVCMVVAGLALSGAVWAGGAIYVPNEYIIRVKPGTTLQTVESTVAQLGATVVKSVALPNTFLIRMGTRSVGRVGAMHASEAYVAASPWVITDFTPNLICRKMEVPNDPRWSDLWGMEMINMPQAWAIAKGTSNVVVAVLDSGVSKHPDLLARVLPGYDYVDNDSDPTNDIDGHGTHVSGTIAAQGDNSTGVVGVCWDGVKILPVRVLNDVGSGTLDWLLSGLDFAMENNADVVNMSLGWDSGVFVPVIEAKLQELAKRDIIICASAGNSGDTGVPDVGAPAMYDECIAVASVGPTKAIAYYSSYGPGSEVDVAAPGGDQSEGIKAGILSTVVSWNGAAPTFNYDFYQGTSMACPHVSGAAALLLSAGFPPREVRSRLQDTAIKPAGYDSRRMGYGIIDVRAALSMNSIQILKPVKGATVSGYPDFRASLKGVDTSSIGIYVDYVTDGSGLPSNIASEIPVLANNQAMRYLNTAGDTISFNWSQISPDQPLAPGLHYVYITTNTVVDGEQMYDWGTFSVAGKIVPAGQHLFAFPYGLMDPMLNISKLPSDLLLDASTSQPLDFRIETPDRARLIRWSAAQGQYISYVTGLGNQLDNTPRFDDRAWLNPVAQMLLPDGTTQAVATAGGFLQQDRTLSLKFPAGTGYWLVLQRDAIISDMPSEFEIKAPKGFGIYLYKGWNLIGNPYTHDVPLSFVQLSYHGETRTLDQDQIAKRPWVDATFYGYESGVGYEIVQRRLLEPYHGYWIRALVGGISPQESLVITVL